MIHIYKITYRVGHLITGQIQIKARNPFDAVSVLNGRNPKAEVLEVEVIQ